MLLPDTQHCLQHQFRAETSNSMTLQLQAQHILDDWLLSCTRANKLSRNTIAVGVVVLDHLRQKSPVLRDEVLSSGGEIVGTRSRLHEILKSYGVTQPEKYLKEVTTRQAHPDGKRLFEMFGYGELFSDISTESRNTILLELISQFINEINKWFDRQALKIVFERTHSPTEWIHRILEAARNKSGGVVEQHLVGAKLQTRHAKAEISNFPGHAGDVQTGRPGDFLVGNTVYHVTTAPSPQVIRKCRTNVESGLYPILLVPDEMVSKAKSFAEYAGIEKRISVIAIEDFIALNLVEMANDSASQFFDVLIQIIEIYNMRLEEVETDMSLKIEVQ